MTSLFQEGRHLSSSRLLFSTLLQFLVTLSCIFHSKLSRFSELASPSDVVTLENFDPQITDCCTYSPDLNSIENLWAIIKRRFQKREVARENLAEVFQLWVEIDAETVGHLYNSFRGRLESVKSNEGAIVGVITTDLLLKSLTYFAR